MPEHLMPVLFIGHGSPLNALEENEFTSVWKKIGNVIPQPKLILCISAHWLQEGTAVTAMAKPKTIHDFYGFPRELYSLQYPATGSPEQALLIQRLVKSVPVELDQEWGLDHGSWSVLKHLYPKATIPVVQLSLDYQLSLEKAVEVGKELSILRQKGVLIIGSGNLVHNLMVMNPRAKPFDWATEFDQMVKESLERKKYDCLINYTKHSSSRMAHPTNDHYLPLLYTLGAAADDTLQFFNEKIVYGSISMRGIIFGLKEALQLPS